MECLCSCHPPRPILYAWPQEQSRHLANYHEQAVFTAPQPDGIGNIAGQTILSPILEALNAFEEPGNKLKLLTLGESTTLLLSFHD